jgi:hypothetical protein
MKTTGAIRSFFRDDEVMTSRKLSVNKTQAWSLLKEVVVKFYMRNAKSGFPAYFDILLQLNTSLIITLKS